MSDEGIFHTSEGLDGYAGYKSIPTASHVQRRLQAWDGSGSSAGAGLAPPVQPGLSVCHSWSHGHSAATSPEFWEPLNTWACSPSLTAFEVRTDSLSLHTGLVHGPNPIHHEPPLLHSFAVGLQKPPGRQMSLLITQTVYRPRSLEVQGYVRSNTSYHLATTLGWPNQQRKPGFQAKLALKLPIYGQWGREELTPV